MLAATHNCDASAVIGSPMQRAKKMARSALVCVCLLACIATASASLVAIDLGSEFLKVSLIKPGRTPIAVVVNEMSKRKSPALVGIVNGERVLGEEAASLLARYPEHIFQRTKDMLGRRHNEAFLKELLESQQLPYTIVEHPSLRTAAIKHRDGALTMEELVASLLYYAKQIASAQSGAPVVDAVVAVPASFGNIQRQAVMDACNLAGLNPLSLINSHAAAALQYGIERDFKDKTQTVIFYDMGASNTHVALVKYSSFAIKESGKENVYNQFQVIDADWDTQLGGNELDMALVQHFAAEFAAKNGYSVDELWSAPKAVAKLRRQVRRTKEVLSANSVAPLSVEELYQGRDFASSITREQFEALAAPFFEAAEQPLRRILQRNGVSGKDVDAVELLGGGSRVPKLQTHLSKALGGRALDRHLDADEAVVLGASLFAANLSTSFRLKKFGMADGYMYGISFKTNAPAEQGLDYTEGEKPSTDQTELRDVIPYMKKLPTRRKVHFKNLVDDKFEFSLLYNTSNPHGVPAAENQEIGKVEVTGISSVIAKYNSSGTVTVRLEVDRSSIVRVLGAEAAVEVEYTEEQVVKPTADNSTNTTNATVSDNASESKDGSINSQNATEEKVVVVKHKTVRMPLKLGGPGFAHAPIPSTEIVNLQKRLHAWQEKEDTKKENARAKNDLESYIISVRELLETNVFLHQAATQEQRQSLLDQLASNEDWLYMDGDGEAAPEFSKRRLNLEAAAAPMMVRAFELEARPGAQARATDKLHKLQRLAAGWGDSKPWINETDRESVLQRIEDVRGWLAENYAKQETKKAFEDPVFKVEEIEQKVLKLEQVVKRINKRPKPAPAKPPVTESNTTLNETEHANAPNRTIDDVSSTANDSTFSGGNHGNAAVEENVIRDEL